MKTKPAKRFSTAKGITTDHSSGLQWAKVGSTARLTHADAVKFCEAFKLGGHTDWRLPTVEELRMLVDYKKRDPAIDTKHFTCESASYWSSSPVAGWPDGAWHVGFGYGDVYCWYRPYELFVRPVRGPVAAPGQ